MQTVDSSASQPLQFYDAEITIIMQEWLSFGVGISTISPYGASNYRVTPSTSIGLNLGPDNWKIQCIQQVSIISDKNLFGRTSIGFTVII